MAASAWTVFNTFRRDLGTNGMGNLSAAASFDMHLFTTAASANVKNDVLSTLGSMSTGANMEVANANGYLQSGRVIVPTWTSGDSIGQWRWDMSDIIWTATGGTIVDIRYAVIVARTQDSGKNALNPVMMRAALTAIEFTLQQGSTLTVSTPAGDGIFELSGG